MAPRNVIEKPADRAGVVEDGGRRTNKRALPAAVTGDPTGSVASIEKGQVVAAIGSGQGEERSIPALIQRAAEANLERLVQLQDERPMEVERVLGHCAKLREQTPPGWANILLQAEHTLFACEKTRLERSRVKAREPELYQAACDAIRAARNSIDELFQPKYLLGPEHHDRLATALGNLQAAHRAFIGPPPRFQQAKTLASDAVKGAKSLRAKVPVEDVLTRFLKAGGDEFLVVEGEGEKAG